MKKTVDLLTVSFSKSLKILNGKTNHRQMKPNKLITTLLSVRCQ